MEQQAWTCHICNVTHDPQDYCDTENDGFELVMDLVRLARAGHPYANELKQLKTFAAKYPKVQSLVNQLASNLS